MGVGERVVCVRLLIKTLPLNLLSFCGGALDFRPEGRRSELVSAVVLFP